MKTFNSVWNALEDDPIKAKNHKIRSELMIAIQQNLSGSNLTQSEIAELLKVNQPRVNALINGKYNEFRLDMLVDYAHSLGLSVSMEIAA